MDNKKQEVYVAKNANGEYLYIGSGREGRHKHCASGTSHCYELNELHFRQEPIFVEVIKEGLTKEDAMLLEHELVKELKPKFNKAVVIKEPDDLDFNSLVEVKAYLKNPIVDWSLLKLVMLYSQDQDIINMVSRRLDKRRFREGDIKHDRQAKSNSTKRSRTNQ